MEHQSPAWSTGTFSYTHLLKPFFVFQLQPGTSDAQERTLWLSQVPAVPAVKPLCRTCVTRLRTCSLCTLPNTLWMDSGWAGAATERTGGTSPFPGCLPQEQPCVLLGATGLSSSSSLLQVGKPLLWADSTDCRSESSVSIRHPLGAPADMVTHSSGEA